MSNSRRARRQLGRTVPTGKSLEILRTAAAWHDVRFAAPVAESTATLDRPLQRTAVREVGQARPTRPGRMLIQLIAAGWSLNGRYYPAEVLKRDGPGAWPAGSQAFIDHPTEEEDDARPAGSVRNLAAVLTSGARWDNDRKALLAEARLFQPWREALTDMAEHIGMSIRAWVMSDLGEREGRTGEIVSEIVEGRSVDFVTRPAAGGAIVSVLESAQPQPAGEARNVGAWLESRLHLALTSLGDQMYGDGRLTRDERITLSSAIGDALQAWTARVEADAPQLFQRDLFDEPETGPAETGADESAPASEASTDDTRALLQRAVGAAYSDADGRCMTWVMDFDPDAGLVWYSDDERHWQQGYSVTDRLVTLADSRIEVVRRTVYDPVPDPADESAPSPPASPAAPSPAPAPAPAPAAEEPEEPAAEAAEPEPPSPAVVPMPVAEVATELTRLDRLLGHTTDLPAALAPANPSADGSPPTAPTPVREESTMSGTQAGARAPDPAGAATEAQPATQPVAASEAQVAVIASERDQYRTRAHSLAEALTESQNAQRTAEAQRDAAVTEMRRYRANEAGRQAVDRLLVAAESGVPEQLQSHIAPRVHTAVTDRVPLNDAGEVDTAALESLVASAIRTERVHAAQLLEAQGVGTVRGLGAEGDPTMQMTSEQFDKQVNAMFRDIGLDESTAGLATKGR